jgi:hypothetical protein
MKLVMTLLARDEEDIIEANLAYHLNVGVDFIIATDNGSRDGTTAILKAYEQLGVLEYHYEPASHFAQHAWVTRMARRAATVHQADWVINTDADEFFVPTHGTLKETLAAVCAQVDVLLVHRYTFPACTRSSRQQTPPIEMVYRKTEVASPKAMHRGVPDVTVAQGNHSVESPHLRLPGQAFPAILGYHYPIRSRQQFESKVWNAGSGYDLNLYLDRSLGRHKRRWYRMLLDGTLNEEYDRLFFDEARLHEALGRGTLIEDRTLSTYLQAHSRDLKSKYA